MLRDLIPDAPIGLFIHATFPSSEIFRCLSSKYITKPRTKKIIIADIFNRPQGNSSWFVGCQFSRFPGKKKKN